MVPHHDGNRKTVFPWSVATQNQVLVFIEWLCRVNDVAVPYQLIADFVNPGSSGQAVMQHFSKIREELKILRFKVPSDTPEEKHIGAFNKILTNRVNSKQASLSRTGKYITKPHGKDSTRQLRCDKNLRRQTRSLFQNQIIPISYTLGLESTVNTPNTPEHGSEGASSIKNATHRYEKVPPTSFRSQSDNIHMPVANNALRVNLVDNVAYNRSDSVPNSREILMQDGSMQILTSSRPERHGQFDEVKTNRFENTPISTLVPQNAYLDAFDSSHHPHHDSSSSRLIAGPTSRDSAIFNAFPTTYSAVPSEEKVRASSSLK